MTVMTPERLEHYAKVVTTLVATAPSIIDAEWLDHGSHCILATRVGIEVLRYFEMPAEPRAVTALFFNKTLADALDAGVEPAQARELPGAWGVGIGVPGDNDEPGKWNGHLVIDTERHLIDLNSGQASRPQRDLPVPPGLLLTRPSDFGEGDRYTWELDDGIRATYQALFNVKWRKSPDWTGDDRHRRTVGRVIRAMKEKLA